MSPAGTATRYEYFVCAGRHEGAPTAASVPCQSTWSRTWSSEYQHLRLMPPAPRSSSASVRREFMAANEQLVAERARQQQRHQQLQAERQKLLQAFYAGALPLELLKTEQAGSAASWRMATDYLQDADDPLYSTSSAPSRRPGAGPGLLPRLLPVRAEAAATVQPGLLQQAGWSLTTRPSRPAGLSPLPRYWRQTCQRARQPGGCGTDLQACHMAGGTTLRRPLTPETNEPPTAYAVRGSSF